MKQLYFFKKKTASVLLSAAAFICSFEGQAQNLVLNPSFEDVNVGSLQCSWYTSQAQFNNAINFWTCPTGGSTDIFNTALATTCYCSPYSTNASSPGTQAPRTGNGYVNIVTYGNGGCTPWREYIQGQLSSALVPGQTYEVEMWVTLADKMAVGTNNIGVKFSTDPYVQASNCPYYTTPDLNYTGPIITDKDNWVQIIFCYTPTVAGLDNFIIGNFYNDAATATAAASGVTTGNTIRYFVEDVRVELVTGSGNAGSDGTLTTCGGNPSSDLFSSLNGLPDTGGSWTGPSALPGGYLGTFDPSIHLPGVYTYSVGGSGLCAGGSSSATVTVSFTNPTANIPTITPVCEGTPISLTENGGSATTWSWSSDGSATFSDPSAQTPTISGAADGETFSVSISDGSGCTNTANYTVSLNTAPIVSANDNGPYCTGDPMSVSETGGSATSWSWTSNGSAVFSNSTDQNPVITGAVDGEIFTVTATDINGCTNTAQAVFTINTLPVVSASDNGPYCANDPMSVSETGGSATSWSWTSNGSAAFSNATDQNPTVTGAVDGEVFTVTATDVNGCSNTAQAVFTINALPTVSAVNDSPVCTGASVNLDEGGGNGVSWNWTSNGGGIIGNSSAQSTSVTGVSNGEIFTVTITDVNGCINSGTTTVIVVTQPVLDLVNDTTVCDNFILPAAISGTNLSGSEAYYTDSQINGGTVISGPITASQTVYIYDGNNGCSDEISFDVTVNSLPTITNTSGGGTYCQGSIVNDILVDVSGSPDWTIDYTLDGVSMSLTSTVSPVSLGNTPGVYVVTNVTDANCTNAGTGTETIIVNPTPGTPAAGSDSVYCLGDAYVDLFANGGSGTLTWYDDASLTSIIGTGTNLSPIVQTGTTSYYVTETLNGCEGPASLVTITINDCTVPVVISIIVPTAFTPNSDGQNDDWEIVNLDTAYPNNTVSIYNRWGNILFFHDSGTDGPYDQNRWDGTFNGTELPVGSYYYVIEYNDPENGVSTGAVSIIRD